MIMTIECERRKVIVVAAAAAAAVCGVVHVANIS